MDVKTLAKNYQLEGKILCIQQESGKNLIPVNIGFQNQGREDETQFDVLCTTELLELWSVFCGEEHVSEDSATYLYIADN